MDQVDFALSYAGEDAAIAQELEMRLRELGFDVFFAQRCSSSLIGVRLDTFFEELFTKAKQVIVLVSEAYKRKDWTQFEWDVIRKRDLANRFIPVRLDDVQLLGLPSTIGYFDYKNNIDELVEVCVKKLLEYESSSGIHRLSEYERVLADSGVNRSPITIDSDHPLRLIRITRYD